MASSKKTILSVIITAIIALLLVVGYRYLYPEHRNIKMEAATYELSAIALVNAFKANEADATKKYIDKTLLVTGSLSSIEETSGSLDGAVFFDLDTQDSSLISNKLDTKLHIKGRCIGYDNLLEEVKIDQATIIE
jgi:hypothetical protein